MSGTSCGVRSKGALAMACVVLASAVALGACKKKQEPQQPPVGGPVDAAAAPAPQDAAPPSAPADAAPAPAADAAAPPTARPPAGGGGLLAGLFGRGRVEAAPAAAPAAAAVARSVQRELLTEGGSGSFARAMEAAKLEQKIGVAAADRPEPAAVQPPPSAVPDGPELCDTLMPAVFACLAADLGEEIGPEVVGEATGECKAEVARLSPEDRAILRGCAGMTDCAAKIACLQQVGDEEEDEGPAGPEPPETAPPPPPPVGDDVCAAFAARTTQCYGAEMPAETVNEIAGACREAMTSAAAVIPDLGQRVAACVPKPCDDVMTCFGEAFSVGATGDTTPEGPGEAPEEVGPAAGGVGDIFGPPPDPARVAALPPETRALCAELAAKLDSCFDALIAQFGGEAMNDPATRQMIQQIRPQFRAGLENACLSAAIEGHEDFQGMAAARRCFALPCDQMIQCITALEQPSAPQEPAPGPMPGP